MKISKTMIRNLVLEALGSEEEEAVAPEAEVGADKESSSDSRKSFIQGSKEIASSSGVTPQERALISLVFKKMLAEAKSGVINSGLTRQHLKRYLDVLEKNEK